jgi:hypothetical protein
MAVKTILAEPAAAATPNLQPGAWPGPITLLTSRRKWWVLTTGASVVAIGLLAVSAGDTAATLIAACFGLFALVCAIMLLPGAGSLRLDPGGFEVSHLFRNKTYRWSDVSEFGVVKFGDYGEVVAFKSAEPLGMWDRMNAALIGGRAYLPDTYGMAVEQLEQLMTVWRDSAADAGG